ncbi:MAG: hypothetical protein ACRCYQ_03520 [Nocardioides sp.]
MDDDTVAAGHVRVGIYTSALRCMISYVLIPGMGAAGALAGLLGIAGVGMQIAGAALCTVGAYRLWQRGHRARYAYAAIAAAVYLLTAMTVLGLA